MTIAATITAKQYTGNGVTTQFAFPNKIFAAADLVVTIIDNLGNQYPFTNFANVTLGLTYTVQGVDVDTGAIVVLSGPLTNLWTMDIRSLIPDLQSTSIKNQGSFLPELHEEAFDRLTRMIQDLLRLTYTYGIHGSDIELVPWPALPGPSVRKGMASMFDAITGLPTIGVPNTQTITTGLLAPFLNLQQSAAEIAAGVVPVNAGYAPYDLRRYGADPTGATPSDAAMVSAIAVCGTNGGTIRAPGFYSFASQINLAGKFNIIIQGDGTPSPGAIAGTRLIYTGTGSGVFINLSSAQSCQIRNAQIYHTNVGFTGTYIAQGGTAALNAAIDCSFGTSLGSVVHLDLNNTINFTGERCVFQYGNPSISGAQVAGFSNAIGFKDCEWFNCPVSPVQAAGTGQGWSFYHCTFEKLTTGAPGALLSTASTGKFVGLDISGGCWFGDATATVGTWIDIYTQGFSFHGNYISGNATGSTAFALRQAVGVAITGSYIDTFLNAINFATATCSNIVVKGNVANNVTNKWVNPANVTVGTFDWSPNFGLGAPAGHGAPANANGYIVEQEGVIRQWGSVAVTIGTPVAVTFPLAFPTTLFSLTFGVSGPPGTNNNPFATSPTLSGFNANIGGSAGAATFQWQAVGN